MSNVLQIIERQEVMGKDFTVYGTAEIPLFMAKDVAEWIGYSKSNVSHMLKNVDEEEKVRNTVTTLGGEQETWFITEEGLYELLMQSRKENAKAFKKEVKKVLKSIRENGFYVVGQEQATDSQMEQLKQLMAQAMSVISQQTATIEGQAKKIEADRPKVEFAEMVEETADEVAVADLALLASQKGTKINRNSMMAVLRTRGYLGKNNRPKQKYVDEGIFTIRFTTIKKRNGETKTIVTPRVTGKGVVYLLSKLCGNQQNARAG